MRAQTADPVIHMKPTIPAVLPLWKSILQDPESPIASILDGIGGGLGNILGVGDLGKRREEGAREAFVRARAHRFESTKGLVKRAPDDPVVTSTQTVKTLFKTSVVIVTAPTATMTRQGMYAMRVEVDFLLISD